MYKLVVKKSYGLAGLLIIFGWLFAANASAGERYAVLVGVSEHQVEDSKLPNLTGPINDVETLQPLLLNSWGFSSQNIITLIDEKATKAAILQALQTWADKVQKGDHVLFYFSGHGISAQAPSAASYNLALPHTSGALLPYDTRLTDGKIVAQSLLIGRTDIRPIFEKLDSKGVYVTAVIDSCYSENSTRSLNIIPTRKANLSLEPSTGDDFGQDSDILEPYPYQRVVTLSASAAHQKAMDIGNDFALNKYGTIDDKFHGAFSDVLLQALKDRRLSRAGILDQNGDKEITYAELFKNMELEMDKRTFEQTPQIQPKLTQAKGKSITDLPLFYVAEVASSPIQFEASKPRISEDYQLRVIFSGSEQQASQIDALSKVMLVSDRPDLQIDRAGAGFNQFKVHIEGELIAYFDHFEPLLEFLRRLSLLDDVLDRSNQKPLATAVLELDTDITSNRLPVGAKNVKLKMRADRAGYPLVVDLFGDGTLQRLYPNQHEPSQLLPEYQPETAFEVDVTEPIGRDHVYLFLLKTPVPAAILETSWTVSQQDKPAFDVLYDWLNRPSVLLSATQLPVYIHRPQAGELNVWNNNPQ